MMEATDTFFDAIAREWRSVSHSGLAVAAASRRSFELTGNGKARCIDLSPSQKGVWQRVAHYSFDVPQPCLSIVGDPPFDAAGWAWQRTLAALKPDLLGLPQHSTGRRGYVEAHELAHLYISEGNARSAAAFLHTFLLENRECGEDVLDAAVARLVDWLRPRVWIRTRVSIPLRRRLASVREWVRTFIIHTGISPPEADSTVMLSPGLPGGSRAPNYRPSPRTGFRNLRACRSASAHCRRRTLDDPSPPCRAQLVDHRRLRRSLRAWRRSLPCADRRSLGDHLYLGRRRQPGLCSAAGALLTAGLRSW